MHKLLNFHAYNRYYQNIFLPLIIQLLTRDLFSINYEILWILQLPSPGFIPINYETLWILQAINCSFNCPLKIMKDLCYLMRGCSRNITMCLCYSETHNQMTPFKHILFLQGTRHPGILSTVAWWAMVFLLLFSFLSLSRLLFLFSYLSFCNNFCWCKPFPPFNIIIHVESNYSMKSNCSC